MAGKSAFEFTRDELAATARSRAVMLGLQVFQAMDMRGSDGPGFPAILLCGKNGVMFRECLDETGGLSPHQERWQDALAAAGADYAVWRPSQWLNDAIEKELCALAGQPYDPPVHLWIER